MAVNLGRWLQHVDATSVAVTDLITRRAELQPSSTVGTRPGRDDTLYRMAASYGGLQCLALYIVEYVPDSQPSTQA